VQHAALKEAAPETVTAVSGGEEVNRADAVKPSAANENAPESFVARLEAERGNKPLAHKPMMSASATPPTALQAAPPAQLDLAEASLDGVVAGQERQLAAQ
jgi:hypothetical protein